MLTLAAPARSVGGTAPASPLLATAPGTLALTGEAVEVGLDGPGFVGVGRQSEVAAWLRDVAHVQVDAAGGDDVLRTTDVLGAAPADAQPPADPRLADIWQQETTGDAPQLRLEEPGAGQVLVAVPDAAARVDMRWDRSARHPGAWPAVVTGVLLLVLGSAWLSVLNARRRRRRRRPVAA